MTPQEEIVETLLENLNGRKGFNTGGVDDKTMEEWKEEWIFIINETLSTALSEALALRVENERLKATLETVVKNIDHCRPGSPNWIESNLYTVMLDIDKALSQPTPTGLTDKLLRLVVAAISLDDAVAEFGETPEFIHENFQALSDVISSLTPEEVNMIEVILK